MSSRSSRLVAASVLIAGCGADGSPEAGRVTERDSAGIRIVESSVDTAILREGWSLGSEPVMVIGGIDASEREQLYGVDGGVILPDGRIIIANGGTSDIRLFTAEGRLDTIYGREGEGPGEYQNPSLAGLARGDSVVVYDAGLRRATILTPDQGAIRSFDVGSEGGGFPLALGVLEDGGLALGGGMAFSSDQGFPSGLVRPKSRHVIMAPDGSLSADFGDLPAVEMWAETDGSSFRARPIAFGKFTAAQPASDRLWIGTGERWEVRAHAPDGTLQLIARLDRQETPVTDRMREAWIEQRLEEIEDPNERRTQRAQLTELPVPDHVPPYQTFQADALDNLWVGEYLLPGEETRTWTIIDPDGRAIGRLSLPPRTFPLDIRSDRMLALTRDELDVESLTLWQLIRPHAP